jgi:hypothetical protein
MQARSELSRWDKWSIPAKFYQASVVSTTRPL